MSSEVNQEFDFSDHSHKRFNPLTESWVLCSPHRAKRPWLGQQESVATNKTPEYLPDCYLCPRNKRVNGEVNPDYPSTFIFPNDFPAVKTSQPQYEEYSLLKQASDDKVRGIMKRLLKVEGVRGEARVVCFSPKHNLTMAQMNDDDIHYIIKAWIVEYERLAQLPHVNYVQIFENKGSAMGCSNPHPHGQVWATEDIPNEPSKEIASLTKYRQTHSSCLLCDTVLVEISSRSRIVCENDSFICFVPFWAVWPFETIIVGKSHRCQITQLTEKEQKDLANILRKITCRYDNLFETSFPYSMGLHGAPTHVSLDDHPMHFHIHFYPPLLRSATVKKFLVGFEMLGQAQRDLTAEQAAERLRNLEEIHYSTRS